MVINAHGCSLALLSRQVHKGDQLLLRNLQTAAMQECTVVHVGDAEGGRARWPWSSWCRIRVSGK